jgi:hypothetical protein
MLSEQEIEEKITTLCQGDGLYLHGHKVKAGYAWEIIIKAPELKYWEAYQAHRNDPSAQFAFVQSMNVWCSSDALKCSDNARDAFNSVRARFVACAEAITSTPEFQQFVGLQADAIEK